MNPKDEGIYSLRVNIEGRLFELADKMGFEETKDWVLGILDDIEAELEEDDE